jgi:hypothetical protein
LRVETPATQAARTIETSARSVAGADWTQPEQANAAVVGRMKSEPTIEPQFLMELSIEPVAAQLGLLGH